MRICKASFLSSITSARPQSSSDISSLIAGKLRQPRGQTVLGPYRPSGRVGRAEHRGRGRTRQRSVHGWDRRDSIITPPLRRARSSSR
jgi:hypothetical protein